MARTSFLVVCAGVLTSGAACSPAPAPTPVANVCPVATPPPPPPPPPACPTASAAATPDAGPPPPAVASEATPADAGPPPVIGLAKGGPRGVRPCEFHESVDTYARTCTVKQNADGSLTVTAPGTALNPNNGFSFRMGGGPERFTATGQLDAFGICRGPFSGSMLALHDGANVAKVSYEIRFRDHCMIVVK